MTHSLPNNPNLGLLKKQAKKLLKQFREGDKSALISIKSNHPKPASFSGLRDAQLVIARRYGFTGWSELSDAVELAQDASKTLPDKANLFVQLGCVQYSGNDTLRNYERARKLLLTYPEIAEFSFYTALVSNNAQAVSSYLASDATLATTSGGPLTWPPLLYVLYSRIGEPNNTQHSVAIVKQLLECGANPDTHVMLNDTYRFTALTGAMGEGEQGVNQPPHQYAEQLANLLLDAGANPNDGQGLYNTMFTDSGDKWLALLIDKGLKVNDSLNWDAPNHDENTTTLNYQLATAVDSNRESRVTLLLNAGANPNARNTYNNRAIHTNALLAGYDTIAKQLLDAGAVAEELNIKDQFKIACVKENNETISLLLSSHPELTEDAGLLHAAAEHASHRVLTSLISKGFDINGMSKQGRTLLHTFALKNDAVRVRALLGMGARLDILDSTYNSSAAGFAAHSGCYEALFSLLDASDSLPDVVCCAYLDRARVIVENSPNSVHDRTEAGNSVLHVIGAWLHDEPEYETYKSIIEMLLQAGADIYALNKQGQTPAQYATANGYDTLAELLGESS